MIPTLLQVAGLRGWSYLRRDGRSFGAFPFVERVWRVRWGRLEVQLNVFWLQRESSKTGQKMAPAHRAETGQ